MNKNRTCTDSDAELTQHRSGPVRYELIDKDGKSHATYPTAWQAGLAASLLWPDQEQDEDRTGKGWDVQLAGCDSNIS